MNSSMPNTKPVKSPKKSTAVSGDVETRANRLAADQMTQEVMDGFRKLSLRKLARKNKVAA
jgi:hypothetical protein